MIVVLLILLVAGFCFSAKTPKVHIEKGNGWVRYYTNEGWSEE